MEMNTFVRKPFLVEATEITKDNIEEIASKIGTLKYKGDGEPWIQVDPRVVEKIRRVYVGFWLTEIDGSYRCYSPKAFNKEFVKVDDEIMPWVEWMNRTEKEGQDGTLIEDISEAEELPQPDLCEHNVPAETCETCASLRLAEEKRIEPEVEKEPLPAAPADGSAEIPPGDISGEVATSAPVEAPAPEGPRRCVNCRSVQLTVNGDSAVCGACGEVQPVQVTSQNVFDKAADAGLD